MDTLPTPPVDREEGKYIMWRYPGSSYFLTDYLLSTFLHHTRACVRTSLVLHHAYLPHLPQCAAQPRGFAMR